MAFSKSHTTAHVEHSRRRPVAKAQRQKQPAKREPDELAHTRRRAWLWRGVSSS
jgi:hypothetical protein